MNIAVATLLLAVAVSAGGAQAAQSRQLSAADDRKEIHVHVGDTVMVAMHDELTWKMRSTNHAILAPIAGLKLKQGIQGVFRAKAPGTATIQLEGSPRCAPGFTGCAPFVRSVIFPVTVES